MSATDKTYLLKKTQPEAAWPHLVDIGVNGILGSGGVGLTIYLLKTDGLSFKAFVPTIFGAGNLLLTLKNGVQFWKKKNVKPVVVDEERVNRFQLQELQVQLNQHQKNLETQQSKTKELTKIVEAFISGVQNLSKPLHFTVPQDLTVEVIQKLFNTTISENLEKSNKENENKLLEWKNKSNESEEKYKKLNEEFREFKTKQSSLDSSTQKTNDELKKQLESEKKALEQLNTETENRKKDIDQFKNKINEKENELANTKKELETSKKKIEEINNTVKESETKTNKIKSELEEIKKQFNTLVDENNESLEKKEYYKKAVEEQNQKIKDKNQKIKSLENQLQSASNQNRAPGIDQYKSLINKISEKISSLPSEMASEEHTNKLILPQPSNPFYPIVKNLNALIEYHNLNLKSYHSTSTTPGTTPASTPTKLSFNNLNDSLNSPYNEE